MRANRDAVVLLILIAAIFGVGIWAVTAAKYNQEVSARAETQRKAVAWRAHLYRKAAAWKAHLQREAWNKKHPAEVAARKAEARATIASEEAAREEAARRRAEEARVAAARQAEADRIASAQRAEQEARTEKEAHPCESALDLERKSADAINGSQYQETYDLAVSGLHYAELCDNDNEKIVNEGYLLSFKAVAEHNLTSGDSRTDLNQAITLLAQCQTLPGIYGTHAGAQCESQEETDISYKTNWEMGN